MKKLILTLFIVAIASISNADCCIALFGPAGSVEVISTNGNGFVVSTEYVYHPEFFYAHPPPPHYYHHHYRLLPPPPPPRHHRHHHRHGW